MALRLPAALGIEQSGPPIADKNDAAMLQGELVLRQRLRATGIIVVDRVGQGIQGAIMDEYGGHRDAHRVHRYKQFWRGLSSTSFGPG